MPSAAFVAVLDPQGAAVSMLAGDLDPWQLPQDLLACARDFIATLTRLVPAARYESRCGIPSQGGGVPAARTGAGQARRAHARGDSRAGVESL